MVFVTGYTQAHTIQTDNGEYVESAQVFPTSLYIHTFHVTS